MSDNILSLIEPALAEIPDALHARVRRDWQLLADNDSGVAASIPERWRKELVRIWAMSEFVALSCARSPALLAELLAGDLERSNDEHYYASELMRCLEGAGNEAQLSERLRLFRRREMVRIAWRDLAGRADMVETTADLSHLADACIEQALAHLYHWHCAQWGTPIGTESRTPQHLIVIGMGKLGAHELNFSSDVDLIFTYPEEGETEGGPRQIANQEFFIRLGQRLNAMLEAATAHGFVFRVDMRLRPFGESSALAISFDAMEDYYQVHGREWERYAMIKARVVAGDKARGAELMKMLRPFVFRRYVDFGAFESLREMKAMIAREVQRKGMDDNIKLGAGGIREVEFIGQAFQLIHGGREKTLQARRILTILEALRGFEYLPDFVVDELVIAYFFLRNTEHRLQEYAEEQTHMLPRDEEGRLRLAFSMGFDSWPSFEKVLRGHMHRVHQHFEQVFAAPQTEHGDTDTHDLTGVWQGILDEEQAYAALAQAGYSETGEVYRRVQQLRHGRGFLNLGTNGRSRMNHLVPLLLGAAGQHERPDATFYRLLALVESIAQRSAYLALLVENPIALSQLVQLCGASPWITELLTRSPHLLDELLDPRTLYHPPPREEFENELRQRLMAVEPDDLEQQMEVLRQARQAAVLRVAAADVMEAVPLMVVSDHLTGIAEVILDAGLTIAWHHLVARHGRPMCGSELVCDTGFAIVAYGKLGGIELGYGSDLDVVFLHSSESEGLSTNGAKPLENAIFYARLAQRIIHILTARTPSGVLYEVDTRLRPSGASGLLVSGVEAFRHYQESEAWTWEHQALVRARVVSGDPAIAGVFKEIRSTILSRHREPVTLRREVREMREKMRTHLAAAKEGEFDLKQGSGGIADIEFMVQYGVLAWSHDHPALLEWTDNIRLLEGFAAAGLMRREDAQLLSDAYRAFRARVHRLTLQDLPAVVDASLFSDYRQGVQRIWHALMEG